MEYLKIKNWEEYQHYKDRCPPWIKLHVKILNDRAFSLLSRASKCLQMLLWILASETDGVIKNDIDEIRFRLRDETIEESEINLLIEKGFLLPENNGRKHLLADACLETETETEKEHTASVDADEVDFYLTKKKKKLSGKRLKTFDLFWESFNHKKGRAEAADSWLEIPFLTDALVDKIIKAAKLEALNRKELKEQGTTPKMAQGWLSGKRWEDEVNFKPQIRYEQVG